MTPTRALLRLALAMPARRRTDSSDLFQTEQRWWPARDGDPDAHRLMARHYSRVNYADNRPRRLFVGPGGKMVLVTADGLAVFIWRKFIDDSGFGGGVNCAAFRNEGPHQSSDLILEAHEFAWRRWPGERLYTYVNPEKVRSTNPGCCFKRAGWKRCGVTKGGLIVLELASPGSSHLKRGSSFSPAPAASAAGAVSVRLRTSLPGTAPAGSPSARKR